CTVRRKTRSTRPPSAHGSGPRSTSSHRGTARRCCCGTRGCRTTRSRPRRAWRAVRSGRRWRGRGGGWWKPMNQEARGNMSHVDDGALHAYLDGELSPVERERLEAHLADCAPCRARLDEERGLVERASQLLGLASPPERAAPPPLHQLRQPRLMWRLRMPLAWAASVVLAVSLGYYVGGASLGRVAPSDSHDAMVGLTRTPPADSPALTPPAVAFSERSAATPSTGTPRHPPAPQPTPDAVVAREEHLVEQRAAEARPESAAAGQRLIELRGANALAGTPAEAGR